MRELSWKGPHTPEDGDYCIAEVPDHGPAFLDAEGAHLELVPSRTGTAGLLLPAVLLLITLARIDKVDAEEGRTEQRQHNGGSYGSVNVGDGIRHRHGIQ